MKIYNVIEISSATKDPILSCTSFPVIEEQLEFEVKEEVQEYVNQLCKDNDFNVSIENDIFKERFIGDKFYGISLSTNYVNI